MQRSIVLSELRAIVTGASVDYVGSVTIHEELCDALGLLDRQMVHIRKQQQHHHHHHCNNNNNNNNSHPVVVVVEEESGRGNRGEVDLWTYVIRGRDCPHRCPPGTVCLNGAAAHLVQVGDIVTLTARGSFLLSPPSTTKVNNSNNHKNMMMMFPVVPRRWDAVQQGVTDVISRMGGLPDQDWAADAILEYACGKIHRPRVTDVVDIDNNPHTHTNTTTTTTTTKTTTTHSSTEDKNHTTTTRDMMVLSYHNNFPALFLDANWAQEGNIYHGETVHLVNVTNGQRDIVTAQYAPPGSQQCAIHNLTSTSTISTATTTTLLSAS